MYLYKYSFNKLLERSPTSNMFFINTFAIQCTLYKILWLGPSKSIFKNEQQKYKKQIIKLRFGFDKNHQHINTNHNKYSTTVSISLFIFGNISIYMFNNYNNYNNIKTNS